MSTRTTIITISIGVLIFIAGAIGIYTRINSTPSKTVAGNSNLSFGTNTSSSVGSKQPKITSKPAVFGTKVTSIETEVYDSPVAGAIIYENKQGTTSTSAPTVRFIASGDGHMFDLALFQNKNSVVSNTTLQHINEAQWVTENNVLIRYQDTTHTIKTYNIKILGGFLIGSTTTPWQGAYLEDNIMSLAVSPAHDKIFYLVADGSGSVGYIANPDGSKKTKAFSSDLQEWQVAWPSKDVVALTTKPSSVAPGYLYFLNTKTFGFQKVLGNLYGLTNVVDPTGTLVAYTSTSNPSVIIYNIKSGASVVTQAKTLSEKCVWSKKVSGSLYCTIPFNIPTGDYPDNWYQGLVTFSDDIWKISPQTGEKEPIIGVNNPAIQGADMTNLTLSPNEDYLTFINKTDATLWSVDLTPPRLKR